MLNIGFGLGFRRTGAGARRHVILLVGQSNMVGRPAFDGGAAYPAGTLQWGRNGADDGMTVAASSPLQHHDAEAGDMGFALEFSIDFLSANPGADLILVPCAKGNSGFRDNEWNPGDPLYNDAVARANAAMAAHPGAMLTILWHQGERDAQGSTAEANAYANALDALIAGLRADIEAASHATPFILGGLAPAFVGSDPKRLAVQAAIEAVPARHAHTAYAPSIGLSVFDGIHFDAASLRTLGARYAAALSAAAANAATAPGPVSGLDATPGEGEVALSWTAPADTGKSPITDYVIEVDTGSGFAPVSDGVGTGTAFTHTGLVNGTAHTYRVFAVNALGAGPASGTASATPAAPDTTPDAFAFTDVADAAPLSVHTDTITVSGINAPAPIAVSAGEYRIGAGAWTASAGTVQNGDSVSVRLTASAAHGTAVAATLTIGGAAGSVSDTFTVTTAAAAGGPQILAFDHGESGTLTAQTYTFTGLTVAAGAVIIIATGRGNGAPPITGVTVGGVSATKIGSIFDGSHDSAAFIAEGVAGTSADVEVAWTQAATSGSARCGLAAWSVGDAVAADCTFSSSGGSGTGITSRTASINVSEGGLLLAHVNAVKGGADPQVSSWTGVSERLAGTEVSPGFNQAAADHAVGADETGRTVTAVFDGAYNYCYLALVHVAG